MSYFSCISKPENDRYIQIHNWQIKFCLNNRCAALLLAFFTAWHDWKSQHDHYYRRMNDIAEMHGDNRSHNEKAYLFFTMDELIDGCMGFYGKNAISQALQLLISLKVISVHKNPNPRYHFDKTKYFQFYPSICNLWLAENDFIAIKIDSIKTQDNDLIDQPNQDDRRDKNEQRNAKIGQSTTEIGRAITNTTNNTTIKNNSIKAGEDVNENKLVNDAALNVEIEGVVEALIAKGFPAERFQYSATVESIHHLLEQGATIDHFEKAFELAEKATTRHGKRFGLNYLAKVVLTLIESAKSPKINYRRQSFSSPPQPPPEVRQPYYENDFSKGLSWMGDLLEGDNCNEFTAKS